MQNPKKCNPVKQGSTNLKHGNWIPKFFTVGTFSLRNCQRSQPPTMPIGFDFEMEKRIKQRKAERVLEDKHFKFM